jgi:hypothetical protein
VQPGMKKFHGVKLKIILPLIFILLVVFLASSLVIIERESKAAKDSLINNADSFSSLSIAYVIENYELYYESGFYKFAEVIDNLMSLNKNIEEIQIVDVNGKILFDSAEIQDGKYDERTYGERFLENATLMQRAGDPVSSLILNEKTRRVDIIQPFFEQWGRHDYSVRYIFSLSSLDTMTQEMIVTISLS